MKVICLQEEAFYELIDEVVKRIKEKNRITHDPWVSPERAMKLLNVKSKSTMQKLRDTGQILFTQPKKKLILNSYDSIMDYLSKHQKKTFS